MSNRPSTQEALALCQILKRDAAGKVRVVTVPGHDNRQYQVIIRREHGLSVECLQDIGSLGFKPCQAAENFKLCYHARIALIVAAMNPPAGLPPRFLKFYKVRPTKSPLANIGKHMIPVRLFRDNKNREFVLSRKVVG